MENLLITEGDWYISGDEYPTIQSRNLDEKIVVTHPTIATINSTFIDKKQVRANAKLIASSPKLLKACIKALKDIQILNKQLIKEGKHEYILMENELNEAINLAI